MFISPDDDVPGILTELDPDAATAVLNVGTANMHPAIIVGATFPVCDSYWAGKLDLVLNDDIYWTRTRFVAPDAFVEPSEVSGWRKWRIATPDDKERTDGRIVPRGWDHEHCELCWQEIGSGGEADGYVSGSNQWVCVRCYDRFIGPRDMRFVIEGESDEPEMFQQISELIDDYDLAAIRQFLEDGKYVNIRSKYGWTPLMLAASRGHQSLISLLLEAGADVNAVSEQHGYTALALAAQMGNVQVVETLLGAGARVQVPEKLCGGSLLTYVKTGSGRENARTSELLTQAGAK